MDKIWLHLDIYLKAALNIFMYSNMREIPKSPPLLWRGTRVEHIDNMDDHVPRQEKNWRNPQVNRNDVELPINGFEEAI